MQNAKRLFLLNGKLCKKGDHIFSNWKLNYSATSSYDQVNTVQVSTKRYCPCAQI